MILRLWLWGLEVQGQCAGVVGSGESLLPCPLPEGAAVHCYGRIVPPSS